jgi:Vanillate O-demethylase oxygenase C-terminal domain
LKIGAVTAFTEDRDMIGAQARNIALSDGIEMLPLSMDAALIQYRRIVDAGLAAQLKAELANESGRTAG